MSHTKCKLNDGREMRIWSNNVEFKCMHLYPEEKAATFDVEADTVTVYDYEEIAAVEHQLGVWLSPEEYAKTCCG